MSTFVYTLQTTRILIDGLYTSLILKNDQTYVGKLTTWLNEETNWKLCYRASKDGWSGTTFHSLCDNKGPTVTVVSVGTYIFGGYASISWGGKLTKYVYSGPGLWPGSESKCELCFSLSLSSTWLFNILRVTSSPNLLQTWRMLISRGIFCVNNMAVTESKFTADMLYCGTHRFLLSLTVRSALYC